jgi:hypothetical protein
VKRSPSSAVGTDLLGARGLKDDDQRRIDRTVVRFCAGRVYSAKECALHDHHPQ